MSINDIENRLIEIKALLPDHEAAHAAEDQLREDFIRYVSENIYSHLSAKAHVVLSSSKIEFPRHCA